MKKVLLVFVLMIFLLTSCGEDFNVSLADEDYSSMIAPNILECGDDVGVGGEVYYYIIDKNTGVVYLAFDSYERHGLTLMVNRDGSPITAEQLGIKYWGDRMIKFMSEHWVIIYGMLMFEIGQLVGYLRGKRWRNEETNSDVDIDSDARIM